MKEKDAQKKNSVDRIHLIPPPETLEDASKAQVGPFFATSCATSSSSAWLVTALRSLGQKTCLVLSVLSPVQTWILEY